MTADHDVFEFHAGESPLVVSIPHDGRDIPADIRSRMTPTGRAIPDTDWHVRRLYDFAADMGASIIAARLSRYVVDLNRAPDDTHLYPGQVATGLCPAKTFAGEAIYADGAGVDDDERNARTERFWRPYHAQLTAALDAARARHGHALLWDAHSIPSRVPRLFDGELPVLNIGSNDGASCAPKMTDAVATVAAGSGYDWVVNGRFRGGFITRHYGQPKQSIHALQLEIAQRAYMDETTLEYDVDRAARLRDTLSVMLDGLARAGREYAVV